MAAGPFDVLLVSVGGRLDEIRQQLYYSDAHGSGPDGVQTARFGRAMAYVALAAALEEFVRKAFERLCDEINREQISVSDARLGIIALEQAPLFESVASGRKQRMWNDRTSLLQRIASTDTLVLNRELRPMDGRTIRARHIETLWKTFEIEGRPLPRSQIYLALEDLSVGRNAVAHGNADPITFGRRKAFGDILARVDQVEELVIHIVEALNVYVGHKRFCR